MKKEAIKYLLEEILEEGSLYICFKYLEGAYGVCIKEFKDIIMSFYNKGICEFYIYGHNNEIIKKDIFHIDFSEVEKMKFFSFSPTDKIWDEIKKYN